MPLKIKNPVVHKSLMPTNAMWLIEFWLVSRTGHDLQKAYLQKYRQLHRYAFTKLIDNYKISFIGLHVVLTIFGKMENVKVNIVVNWLNCF